MSIPWRHQPRYRTDWLWLTVLALVAVAGMVVT